MKSTRDINRFKPLKDKEIFTSIDVRKCGIHPALVNYYIKIGVFERVKRGVYRHAAKSGQQSFRWQDLIEAVISVPGSSICLTSALAIYGLTEEIPRQHWIAIPHSTSAKAPKNTKIVRFRNFDLGYTRIKLDGVEVPIFDIERTIIDAFRLLSIETAIKALKFAVETKAIDLVVFCTYARKLRINVKPYLLSLTL